jgi:similar to stage IV sporulation protein
MLTKEQVKQLALTHFSQFLSELEENGVRIVDKNVMIEQIDKNYHIYGQVKGCEKITTLVPTEMKREEPVNESE